MTKQQLTASIQQTLTRASQGEDQGRQVAAELSDAIDAYIVSKLNLLKVALIAPGAFAGTGGGPAPVIVTPASIARYEPNS